MTTKLILRPRTIVTYLTALTTYIITLLLSTLPLHLQQLLTFYTDLLLSAVYISLGRFLPYLDTPDVNLTGKVAIVTGANSGLGLQIAADLARQGATVYLACRSLSKATQAVNTIIWRVPSAKGRVLTLALDTSDLESVRDCALLWSGIQGDKGIDILVHNAGIADIPRGGDRLTGDGVEMIYATNFLGAFLLTYFLEPYLKDDARVILTSSTGQYFGRVSEDFELGPVRGVSEAGFHCPEMRVPLVFGGGRIKRDTAPGRYANSKFMQVCFARLLQERFDVLAESKMKKNGNDKKTGGRRIVHAFAPGFVYTPIFGKWDTEGWVRGLFSYALNVVSIFSIDVEQGANTGSWLAMTNQHKVVGSGNGGGYWDRMRRMSTRADLMDRITLDRLWIRWEKDAGVVWS